MPRLLRCVGTLLPQVLVATAAAQQVSFDRDVLPLLSDRCFSCHGPDAGAREADLRLDEREAARNVLVAGDPAASELIRRIQAHDADVMPPRDSGLSLRPDEVALLVRWVEQGAPWSEHWAFAPPSDEVPPAVQREGWAKNDVDRFVLARLERERLQPNGAADPAALLRRVTLDLTGLPPTPEELDAFVADPSDRTYEAVVDRLLASPHFGERMAWPWLEAGRYADTDGYQGDPVRTAWPWRDWLVAALNDNVPFDRLTVEMLAGDLLPGATQDQRLATAFLRNNAHNGEGGRIAEETRIENGFDRTETVATVWMGLTLGCARCHDHKYDPIPQRDYYRLFAFFDQTSETGAGRSGGELAPSMRCVVEPAAKARHAALERQRATLRAELLADDATLDGQQHERERRLARAVRRATDEMPPSRLGPWQRTAEQHGDAAALLASTPEAAARAGFRAEEGLVDGEVFRLPEGVFAVWFRRTIDAPTSRQVTLSFGSDDAIQVWLDGALVLSNDVRRGAAPDQERVELELAPRAHELLVKVVNTGGVGGFYCRVVDETVASMPAAEVRALLRPEQERTEADRELLRRAFRGRVVAGYTERALELDAVQRELEALEQAGARVSVMDELPVGRRRATRVLERGNYLAPRDVVTAGMPAFLPPLDAPAGTPPDRLALARWLVSGEHPLTARVAVNRIWQVLFGRGLVATSEDFGRQGERPSHPELLDWLARRFVRSGWDQKALVRLLVTSATYRQAADADPERFVADPHNVLLARSARRRWPAWMLRDQALALSGRLVPRLGGAPVRPYQPDGVWAEATFGQIVYRQGEGEDLYRRTLYTFWRRIVGPTVLFDTPERQTCVVRHEPTNTPLHALTTLNETGFVEAARGLAERALRGDADDAARLVWLFRAATARRPDATELAMLQQSLEAARRRFVADPDAAARLLTVGAWASPVHLAAPELAAFTIVASLVLNLDEVLTRP